jgi:CTP:molybdopterin cytidylyltransferase MocA
VIAAVVLAAGAASRYGSPKQRLYLPAVLERLAQTSIAEIVVVEGAHTLAGLDLHGARLVACPDWELGPGASLRCGLNTLGADVDAALIVLADGPELDPRAVERLLEHRGDGPVVVASYDGTRDHPALLGREVWAEIPDEGARTLAATLIPCDDLRPPGDFDYPPA